LILARQRDGFTVEGMSFDSKHPLHPDNKTGIFVKALKSFGKKPNMRHSKLRQNRKPQTAKEVVLPNKMVTTPTLPRGSYAS
jgi:hypothetical protein